MEANVLPDRDSDYKVAEYEEDEFEADEDHDILKAGEHEAVEDWEDAPVRELAEAALEIEREANEIQEENDWERSVSEVEENVVATVLEEERRQFIDSRPIAYYESN